MSVYSGLDFGNALCKILKLDPKKTRDIVIKNMIDDFVRVEVTQILQDEEAKEILIVLKEYELHAKEDPERSALMKQYGVTEKDVDDALKLYKPKKWKERE